MESLAEKQPQMFRRFAPLHDIAFGMVWREIRLLADRLLLGGHIASRTELPQKPVFGELGWLSALA
jgi:hypothetical protein